MKALAFLENLLARSDVVCKIVVVNDVLILEDIKCATGGRWKIVRGSNSFGEFSAWNEGLKCLTAEGDAGNVIFANDTVCTHQYFSQARISAIRRSLREHRPNSFVGFTGHANGALAVANKQFPFWISTYFFVLGSESTRLLGNEIFAPALVNSCVAGGSVESEFFQNMSQDLETRLRSWLFRGGWYKSEPLTEKNKRRFEFKAKCVVAEMLLSANCFEQKIPLIDPFYRYPMLGRLDGYATKLKRYLSNARVT